MGWRWIQVKENAALKENMLFLGGGRRGRKRSQCFATEEILTRCWYGVRLLKDGFFKYSRLLWGIV